MESLRNGEESESRWIPFTLFHESSIAVPLLKFFGLERYSSSSSFSSSSSSGSLSSSSEDEAAVRREEEEDEAAVRREEEEDDVAVEITLKAKKGKSPPRTSPGSSGKTN